MPQFIGVWTGQIVLVPEQDEAGVNIDPLQLAAMHIAVEVWQLPAPSQTFVLPHPLPTAPQPVSVVPLGSGAQVPALPATLQDWQAGQLVLPQQAPLMQLPVMHSLPAEQLLPLVFRLQLIEVPVPWQVNGTWQSVLVVQEVLQALVPQM